MEWDLNGSMGLFRVGTGRAMHESAMIHNINPNETRSLMASGLVQSLQK